MQHPKRWIIAPVSPATTELAARLKTSPLVAQALLNRGLTEPEQCATFLAPTLKQLHDPESLPNLTRAAERIAQAIRARHRIVIYGDYDVDGITGTVILWHAIRLLGGIADYYIPHRLEEGYGLNADAIQQLCTDGAQLIVTVDCGVTAADEADVCRRAGVDLIITDHHDLPIVGAGCADRIPDCYALVHPRLPTATPYLNPHLCGSGVAFKLAWGIGQAVCGAPRVGEDFRRFLLDATALAALGTIADVVPLQGENRILAHFGLKALQNSTLPGLRALIASAGLTGQPPDSYHVGFVLAPRLNACGRMGHARQAVEMLTTADSARAAAIAEELDQQNRARQAMEKQIFEQALAQVAERGFDSDRYHAIVLGAQGWHGGVIGIVASRIVGRFHRPAILVAMNGEEGQGSGRSISGFHLAEALHACREYLQGCGGHEMAAGLSLASSNFEAFREAFCDYAARTLDAKLLVPELRIDCEANLRQINDAVIRDLQRLGPFGHGNRKPLFCCTDAELILDPRRVGRAGEHLQLYVRQGGASLRCIAFQHGALADRLSAGSRLDLAFEPGLNTYNGHTSVQLEVRDIRLPS